MAFLKSALTCGRECHGEFRTLSGGAADLDISVIQLYDVFDDGETKARATHAAGPSLVHPVEPLKNPGQACSLNSDAAVGDMDDHFVYITAAMDGDGTALHIVFYSIIDEIDE